ncbi:MAG: nicotinate phosphoribosyltransferase [Planctomycetes bacterium]|nr:nicotinate phosphoribosyltransferase [Planctomycetota bacterium]
MSERADEAHIPNDPPTFERADEAHIPNDPPAFERADESRTADDERALDRAPDSPIADDELALVTDLYQLTMLQTYFEHRVNRPAVFELVFRTMPPTRNFLVAAGLATALDRLQRLAFSARAIGALERTRLFKPAFLEHLGSWRFRGEVWAIPEGLPVFPREPILQVIAPLEEAQLVETLLLNVVQHQTLVAAKAARIVRAAEGRAVFGFGLRRAHGLEAGMHAARAAFIGGVEATANVLAGLRWNIPIRGTMAHSAIKVFGDDLTAFRAFAETDPETTCLVDTFDTLAGVDAVIRLAHELGDRFRVKAIRIDSGDLASLARAARARLDAAGLQRVGIVASGGLDEQEIARIVVADRQRAIDGFGVGTSLDVSADAPCLDVAYKLVEYDGRPKMKLSSGKRGLPCRKQVFRAKSNDLLALHGEPAEGRPLLEPAMQGGVPLPAAMRPLADLRARSAAAIAELPAALQDLGPAPPYVVRVSPRLQKAAAELEARLRVR